MELYGKKENRRVKRTKKALRDALITLLETKSVNKITIMELTTLADVNRSTFYLYYTDIYDMMEKIQDEIYSYLVDVVVNRITDFNSTEEFVLYCRNFLDFCRENYTVCKFITRNDCNNTLAVKVKKAIRSVVPDSANKYDKSHPMFYMTTYALSAMIAVVIEWMDDGMIVSSEDMANFLCSMYVFGSRNVKNGTIPVIKTEKTVSE